MAVRGKYIPNKADATKNLFLHEWPGTQSGSEADIYQLLLPKKRRFIGLYLIRKTQTEVKNSLR